jgi:hypothetical protein
VLNRALLPPAFAIAAILASVPGQAAAGQWGYPYPQVVAPDSSVHFEVKPKQAEVFVDGYYAGIVDDFDGAFQRLRLPPGEHVIQVYLSGYHTFKQSVFLTPDNTLKIKYVMEKLGPSDEPEARPMPPPPPPQTAAPLQTPYPQRGSRRGPPPPQDPESQRPPSTPNHSGPGTLALKIQPADAELYVDGERWRGPEGPDATLLVELKEGRHSIEVRKAGYRTYITDVEIHPGDTTTVNVGLRPQGER